MSVTSVPIPSARFAAALESLSLSSLHSKAAELRNSLLHLRLSNSQLQGFAHDGDADCAEALRENEVVVARLRERLDILKAEVEGRGARWIEWDEEETVKGNENGGHATAAENEAVTNGHILGRVNGSVSDHDSTGQDAPRHNAGGTLNDDELTRRIMEQLEQNDGEEGGLHL